MSRFEVTKNLIDRINNNEHGILLEFSTLLDIRSLLENIALNIAELNDKTEYRKGGLNE